MIGCGGALLLALTALVGGGGSSAVAAIPSSHRSAATAAATPGHWTLLKTTGTLETFTPQVWESSAGKAYILTDAEIGTLSTYEVATVNPSGSVASEPASIFGTKHWGSLSDVPTLVSAGTVPLVIFAGTQNGNLNNPYEKGCVVGAKSASPTWVLQTWSLSANCVNPVGGATEGKGGVLAATWVGGASLYYRIGTSPTIPAATPDGKIEISNDLPTHSEEAADLAGNGDIYVAWEESTSGKPQDGLYVKDISAGGPIMKAPGTGTATAATISPFQRLAFASTNTHKGVYLVYCPDSSANGSECVKGLKLWKVGSSTAVSIPESSDAWDIAASAGPDGRLWVAWFDEQTGVFSVDRSNKADTHFEPVRRFSTSCFDGGLIGLSGGSEGRDTIALQCVDQKLKIALYTTQTLGVLNLLPSSATIANKSGHTVTFKVWDAGDPVSGAKVSVAGKSATTGPNGTVTFSFPKGMAKGAYTVEVTADGYFATGGTLHVTS